MNKKLFEQRLRSLEHYLKELEYLEEAKRVTESTFNELRQSMKEFLPLTAGDICLTHDDRVVRYNGFHSFNVGNNNPYYNLKVNMPTSEGRFDSYLITDYYYLNRPWKIIKPAHGTETVQS